MALEPRRLRRGANSLSGTKPQQRAPGTTKTLVELSCPGTDFGRPGSSAQTALNIGPVAEPGARRGLTVAFGVARPDSPVNRNNNNN